MLTLFSPSSVLITPQPVVPHDLTVHLQPGPESPSSLDSEVSHLDASNLLTSVLPTVKASPHRPSALWSKPRHARGTSISSTCLLAQDLPFPPGEHPCSKTTHIKLLNDHPLLPLPLTALRPTDLSVPPAQGVSPHLRESLYMRCSLSKLSSLYQHPGLANPFSSFRLHLKCHCLQEVVWHSTHFKQRHLNNDLCKIRGPAFFLCCTVNSTDVRCRGVLRIEPHA